MHPATEAFEPLLGMPAWLVRRGFSSYITMEFGEPSVVLGPPTTSIVRDVRGSRVEATQRVAAVHGQWHLWIESCHWTLDTGGDVLASSESDDGSIDRALPILDGQALVDVDIESDSRSLFRFDLGCSLATNPSDSADESGEVAEQWSLYQPDGQVLVMRGDGSCRSEDSERPAEPPWLAPPERT